MALYSVLEREESLCRYGEAGTNRNRAVSESKPNLHRISL